MSTRKINVKVNKDFRCFLAGDEFEFEFLNWDGTEEK